MPVSANTLFHFTGFNSLKGILESYGFWPKYSLEYFHNALPKNSQYLKSYIPMVCFCDLKLTQLSDRQISRHTKDYGEYGIGFHKSWGVKKQISPVSYIHRNSITSLTINEIIKKINSIEDAKDLRLNLSQIIKFLKPYKGNYQKGNRKRNSIVYYDEREWRYIPKRNLYKVFPETNNTKKITDGLNKKMKLEPLEFVTKDIKYIILKNNSEKIELSKLFDTMNLDITEKTDLISKIITMKEIREDF
jgi:Putative abortive phage resistance protein AbiGi, antitoxin